VVADPEREECPEPRLERDPDPRPLALDLDHRPVDEDAIFNNPQDSGLRLLSLREYFESPHND
jgi:hypothetical protein